MSGREVPKGFHDCLLGDVITLQRGFDLPSHERRNGNVPVVSSSGITGWHNTAKVQAPGVVTGRYGTLGEVFYIEQGFWALNTTLFVSDFKGNQPKFISYLLRTLGLGVQNAAGAVPGVNRNVLHKMPVVVPELKIQERIADILSNYDRLIDNNTRRIALLEESIHRLYKEWFVSLRFPGWEKVAIVDGVPEGWSRKPLEAVCELVMGQSPPSTTYNTTGQGLPFHQGVTKFGSRFISHETYCTQPNRIANPGDILCSVRAPVGRLNMTIDKIIIGRGLAAIRNRQGYQSFQFYQLKAHFFQEDLIGSGSIFASVTKKQLSEQMMLIPPELVLQAFESISKPVDKQLINLHLQSEKLREARDLLLPRLMNGSIAV